MASAKSYVTVKPAAATNYRFLQSDHATTVQAAHGHTNSFEFDESDLWGGLTRSNSTELHTPRAITRPRKNSALPGAKCGGGGGVAMSVPVNVPDWSKILREEYRDKWRSSANCGEYGGCDGGDDGGDEEEWVAPHEYLAKKRNASFSMQEGIGRTLKGRDLSRVRNAIWEKTGFQD